MATVWVDDVTYMLSLVLRRGTVGKAVGWSPWIFGWWCFTLVSGLAKWTRICSPSKQAALVWLPQEQLAEWYRLLGRKRRWTHDANKGVAHNGEEDEATVAVALAVIPLVLIQWRCWRRFYLLKRDPFPNTGIAFHLAAATVLLTVV